MFCSITNNNRIKHRKRILVKQINNSLYLSINSKYYLNNDCNYVVVYIQRKMLHCCENRQRVLLKKKIFSGTSILKCQHQSTCEADLLKNKNIFKLCMVDWKLTIDT